jgi:hypothetical protein
MQPWYPSACPYCSLSVDMRQLVGGGWDMFETGSTTDYHRCPHPTTLWSERRRARAPREPFKPMTLAPLLRESNERRSHRESREQRPAYRKPAPPMPPAEVDEPGLMFARPADHSGLPDLGVCARCGAAILRASHQDLCARCLSDH